MLHGNILYLKSALLYSVLSGGKIQTGKIMARNWVCLEGAWGKELEWQGREDQKGSWLYLCMRRFGCGEGGVGIFPRVQSRPQPRTWCLRNGRMDGNIGTCKGENSRHGSSIWDKVNRVTESSQGANSPTLKQVFVFMLPDGFDKNTRHTW